MPDIANARIAKRVVFLALGLSYCSCSIALADMQDIPVPLATIQAGEKISISLLASKNYYVSEGASKLFATSMSEVEGKIAKRTLISGKPIALSYLRQSGAVLQGNPTRVELKLDGLSITTMLIPQQSGVAGETIEALNPESGKIVRAIVVADGTLQIGAQ